jgi:hypothetical protein
VPILSHGTNCQFVQDDEVHLRAMLTRPLITPTTLDLLFEVRIVDIDLATCYTFLHVEQPFPFQLKPL